MFLEQFVLCAKLSHIESTAAPLPCQKPRASSCPVIFLCISLPHRLSKLSMTFCLLLSLLSQHICPWLFPLFLFALSGAPFLSWSLPFLRNTWNQCKFLLYLGCPLNAVSKGWYMDNAELPLKFFRLLKPSCRFLIPVYQFFISCRGSYVRFKTSRSPCRRVRSFTYLVKLG